MGRPSKPCWIKDRKCWRTHINNLAFWNRELRGDQLPEAWSWLMRLKAAVKFGQSSLTFDSLVTSYLELLQKHVELDAFDVPELAAQKRRLALAVSHWDKIQVDQLTAADVERLVNRCKDRGYSAAYRRAILSSLSDLFEWARQPIAGIAPRVLVRTNPIADLGSLAPRRRLTDGDFRRLVRSFRRHWMEVRSGSAETCTGKVSMFLVQVTELPRELGGTLDMQRENVESTTKHWSLQPTSQGKASERAGHAIVSLTETSALLSCVEDQSPASE
jgi:hypothetical protein